MNHPEFYMPGCETSVRVTIPLLSKIMLNQKQKESPSPGNLYLRFVVTL